VGPKRTKSDLHLWLEPQTHAALRELARQRHVSMTDVATRFIQEGLGLAAEEHLDGPALPAVRQTVEAALIPHVERLAALIVKTHLEAGIGERLVFVLVANALGPDKARQFLDTARTKSIEALKRPLGQQKAPAEKPVE
jgi:hypothetical protein